MTNAEKMLRAQADTTAADTSEDDIRRASLIIWLAAAIVAMPLAIIIWILT